MTQQGKEPLPSATRFSWCWWFQQKWPGGALTGERCSRHRARPPTGLVPEHLQPSSSALPRSHVCPSLSCHVALVQGQLSLPQRQLDKAVAKGVLREHCRQLLMDQDTHTVTINIINSLTAPLPPDNRLLPLASLTHGWATPPTSAHIKISRFQSSCPFTWQPLC